MRIRVFGWGVAGTVALALVACGVFMLRAERAVEARFQRGLFQTPSRMLARPLVLERGDDLDRLDLLVRLERLGFRPARASRRPPVRAEDPPVRPERGEYLRTPDALHLGLRGGEPGAVDRVQLRLDERGRISRIANADGSALPRLTLEGELIGEIQPAVQARRKLVAFRDLPRTLVEAVIEMEDRHFLEHPGLDAWRILGASLANLRAGRIVQGGSTITQQLVKNFWLSPERSLGRKLREASMALVLEWRHPKQEILEAYLNEIYLGQSGSVAIHGVGQAAQHYFGREVFDLSLAQAALLAGIIPAPGRYSPFQDPDAALARRALVLGVLAERGRISEEAHRAARAEPLLLHRSRAASEPAPHFVAQVRQELAEHWDEALLATRGLSITTTLDSELQSFARRAVARGLGRLESTYPGLRRSEQPLEAALVALDPTTGEILALVGGRDFARSQFNRATQAKRQPGSVFKPIVALAALSRGEGGLPAFTLISELDDSQLVVTTGKGDWIPVNFDREFRGPVTLRDALERSLNVPMARLGLEVGPARVVETARRLGLEGELRPIPSLALGPFEMSLLEMTRAYGVLAARGLRAESRSYLAVTAPDGEALEQSVLRAEQVFDPSETWLVTEALRAAVERGTGRSLARFGLAGRVAGKTGTTNDFRDAWFIGYTPDLVVGVWVGFDAGDSLGLPASAVALPIFGRFMQAVFEQAEPPRFRAPAGLEFVRIHPESGLRAGPGCPGPRQPFLRGTAPDRQCTAEVWKTAMRGLRWLREQLPGGRSQADGARSE